MDDVGENWDKPATDPVNAVGIKEKFTKKEFDELEAINHHTENAVKLVGHFGTHKELKKMLDIESRHAAKGFIEYKDRAERDALITKYYPELWKESDDNENG